MGLFSKPSKHKARRRAQFKETLRLQGVEKKAKEEAEFLGTEGEGMARKPQIELFLDEGEEFELLESRRKSLIPRTKQNTGLFI